MGKLGSKTSKLPCLRIRKIFISISYLVRRCFKLGSVEKSSHWLELLLVLCRWEFSLPRPMRWLLQASALSLSQSDTWWLNLIGFPAIHWREIRSGGPTNWPQCWGRGIVVPYGLSFPLEEQEAEGRHLCVVVDCSGGRTMQSACNHFSYPSRAVCLGLWGAVAASNTFSDARLSQWCLLHE